MKCCPSREQLQLLVAEQLDRCQRDAVEAHLATCPPCLSTVSQLIGDVQEADFPDRLPPPPPGFVKPPLLPTAPEAQSPLPEPGPETPYPAIPGYEILSELGKGGMGVVYKARQLRLNRVVALKMIRSGPSAESEERKRFATEAEAVARLEHPNIVQIHEIGEWDGQPYISLEFVDGGSLADHLEGKPLAPALAARLVETLARAIHAAHRNGIVHRDLKPANILLQFAAGKEEASGSYRPSRELSASGPLQSAVPKITDFGLAKKLDVEIGQTQSGVIVGTPSYMAPEQASGLTRRIGPGVDIYALGAIFYELLTGRPPFLGETLLDTLQQVRSEDPIPPSRFRPHLPRDVETICLKCLQKEPTRRYTTALDLADDLCAYLETRPIKARPVSLWERAWKWAKRRPAAAVAVLTTSLAALSLLAGALVYQHQRGLMAERELRESLRLGLRHDQAEELIRTGRHAFEAGNLADAERDLTSAANLVRDEPSLASFQGPISQALEVCRVRRAALATQQQFFHGRDQALFHGVLFTGADLAPSRALTRQAATQALELVGISPDREGVPARKDGFSADEWEAIKSGSYECLLAYAESLGPEEPRGQFLVALDVLDRARPLIPRPTRAYHLRRHRYLVGLGQHAEAHSEMQKARSLSPQSALDHFLLGDDLQRQGEVAAAIRSYDEALRLQPDHFWARYSQASCYLRRRQPGDALAARANLTACLGSKPDFVWVYVLRALANARLGETTSAEADFQAALAHRPTEDARYAIVVNRGVLHLEKGKLAAAATDLGEAVRLRPRQYQAYLNLANVRRQQKDAVAALALLDRAIAVSRPLVEKQPRELEPPALARLYRARAVLHRDRDHLDAALVDLAEAIRFEPRAEDHVERGRLHRLRGQHAEALRANEEALRVRAEYPEAHRGRAEALLALNRLAEAVEALDRYFASGGPPTATTYRVRGLAQTALGRLTQALEDFTLAIHLDPDPTTHAQRGWIYLGTDSPRLALADFEKAIQLDPSTADAYAGRGYARAVLGKYREAVADAEESLRRGPESPRLFWNAARIHARVMSRLEAAPARSSSGSLASHSQERGLQLLQKALDRVPRAEQPVFWKKYVQADASLASLRPTAGYRELEKVYARPAR